MAYDEKDILRIGRIEDKIKLYEPLLVSLPGLISIPDEIDKIHTILGILKESRIEVREKLATLFKLQAKASDEIVKSLEHNARIMEKGIKECPIRDVELDVINIKRDIEQGTKRDVGITKILDNRLKVAEDTIEAFKLKGWELLLRIVPWVLAAGASMYAILT